MRTLFIILAIGTMGVVLSGPVYADQNIGTTFSLLGATTAQANADSPLFLLAKRGGGGRGMAFHKGQGHHRGHRGAFFGGFALGIPYGYYSWPYGDYSVGEGYYTEGNKVCEWNGYEYTCFRAY